MIRHLALAGLIGLIATTAGAADAPPAPPTIPLESLPERLASLQQFQQGQDDAPNAHQSAQTILRALQAERLIFKTTLADRATPEALALWDQPIATLQQLLADWPGSKPPPPAPTAARKPVAVDQAAVARADAVRAQIAARTSPALNQAAANQAASQQVAAALQRVNAEAHILINLLYMRQSSLGIAASETPLQRTVDAHRQSVTDKETAAAAIAATLNPLYTEAKAVAGRLTAHARNLDPSRTTTPGYHGIAAETAQRLVDSVLANPNSWGKLKGTVNPSNFASTAGAAFKDTLQQQIAFWLDVAKHENALVIRRIDAQITIDKGASARATLKRALGTDLTDDRAAPLLQAQTARLAARLAELPPELSASPSYKWISDTITAAQAVVR